MYLPLDPDTLEQKERIQLSTSYNILGIDYLPSTGGYLIQTDADGGYGFKLRCLTSGDG